MLKFRHPALAAIASVSLLALAGCNDEQGGGTQTPPPTAENAPQAPSPDPVSPPVNTDDALRRITEGAEAIRDAAQQLAGEARQRTDQLLTDAGPAMDRLAELAREFGVAANEVTERALRDFQTGITVLQQRVDESRQTRPQTGDSTAVLAPADQLRADTRIAARAHNAGVGPAYVGVWAADAVSCAKIDLNSLSSMAVVTPTTIRLAESVCNFAETPLTNQAATLQATCIADDEMETVEIELQMPEDNALVIDGAPALIRCRLPN